VPFERVRGLLHRLVAAIELYSLKRGLVMRAVLLSVAVHGANSLCYWAILKSLSIPAGLAFAAMVYPMMSLVLAVPISVSGIGVRDVFIFTLFKVHGLNPESGIAFSWLLLGLSIPTIAAGALIQLWETFHRPDAS
jgi:uncharacterized membrane protein YbhN (UPF0104 family)